MFIWEDARLEQIRTTAGSATDGELAAGSEGIAGKLVQALSNRTKSDQNVIRRMNPIKISPLS
jgi:hypothetical protein